MATKKENKVILKPTDPKVIGRKKDEDGFILTANVEIYMRANEKTKQIDTNCVYHKMSGISATLLADTLINFAKSLKGIHPKLEK